MTLKEIVEALKSGEMTVMDSGHRTNPILNSLENVLKHQQECATSDEERKQNYGKRALKRDYEFGDTIEREAYCFDCDANSYIILVDENTIGMVDSHLYWDICDSKGHKYGYMFKKEDIPECPMIEARKIGKLVSEIVVETGDLIFKNFFDAECLYETDGAGESINAISGRNALMQYLATQNVGYGQMGNMYVNIFKKNDGTEIIVGDDEFYNYDEETKEEIFTEVKHEGFTNFGSISLSVWRWQCADKAVLKAHNEMPKNIKETPQGGNLDAILTKVKPGKWRIEHYYDFSDCEEDRIYSRLKLIENS